MKGRDVGASIGLGIRSFFIIGSLLVHPSLPNIGAYSNLAPCPTAQATVRRIKQMTARLRLTSCSQQTGSQNRLDRHYHRTTLSNDMSIIRGFKRSVAEWPLTALIRHSHNRTSALEQAKPAPKRVHDLLAWWV
jgi:hypothetical protein